VFSLMYSIWIIVSSYLMPLPQSRKTNNNCNTKNILTKIKVAN